MRNENVQSKQNKQDWPVAGELVPLWHALPFLFTTLRVTTRELSYDKRTSSYDKRTLSYDKRPSSYDKRTLSYDKRTST